MEWITRDIAIGDVDDARLLDELCKARMVSVLSLNGWPNSAFNLGIRTIFGHAGR